MGNNSAFTTFEHVVMTLHNTGKLDIPTLDAIAEFWRGTDIDSGGMEYIEDKDGKLVDEVCVNLIEPDFKPVGDEEDKFSWGYEEEFDDLKHSRWGWC